jgi:hypothetical protein
MEISGLAVLDGVTGLASPPRHGSLRLTGLTDVPSWAGLLPVLLVQRAGKGLSRPAWGTAAADADDAHSRASHPFLRIHLACLTSDEATNFSAAPGSRRQQQLREHGEAGGHIR